MSRGGSRKGAGRKKRLPEQPDDPSPKRGAPSSYKPEFVEQARKLCALGATDVDLGDFFGVRRQTIWDWGLRHEDFADALKAGKAAADERVARSLYHRAVGYTFDSEKVFQFQGAVVRAPIREHVPPDTTAAIFWLKNRRKDEWRDRQEHELTGKDGGPIKTEDASPFETARRLAFILAQGQRAKPKQD